MAERPGSSLLLTGGEVGPEVEEVVRGSNDAVEAGLGLTDIRQKIRPVAVIELRDLGFDLCADNHHICILLGAALLHLFNHALMKSALFMALGALVWRTGGFGFPAGVLLPLGVVGLVVARRRLTGVLPLFVGVYGAGLVLVALFAVRPVVHSWMMDLSPPNMAGSAAARFFFTAARVLSVL